MMNMVVENRGVVQLLVIVVWVLQIWMVIGGGSVYKVGDAAGWTSIGNVDYKQWVADKTFQIGDVVVFEYNPQFHNVMQVAHAMYKSCNASFPIATYNTGNDSITIKNDGHHYFLCSVPGHCQSGQKLDINVVAISPVPAPSPSGAAPFYATFGIMFVFAPFISFFA